MESDLSYYTRRAVSERLAAARALTDAARRRRMDLADSFAAKALALKG